MKKVSKFFIYFSLLFLYAGALHAAEYVAFSLKVAKERIISTPEGKDYRKLHPEVFTIGGITAIKGLVYDKKTGDIILVGQRDSERAILTLDDFVVALRARFIHGKWPLVSIDPVPETEKTNMQVVRFEGGIEDTQFGQDLFDADYRLKKIGMGLLPSGVPGLKTYWDLGMERAKAHSGGSYKIGSRFWFYPVLPSVTVREDVVAIRGLKVGVFTEVLSAEIDGKKIEDLSTFQDQAGDRFAKEVSEKFENLARVHPSFSRLQGLDELVALTKAIEEMDERPDLDWWFEHYRVKEVRTEKSIKALRRSAYYKARASSGEVRKFGYTLLGGVELVAVALRLKAGDVTALKEAVLKTMPKSDALTWSFIVAEWLIPTSPGMLKIEDLAPLFAQAIFLRKKERYDDAISLYGKIIKLKPNWSSPHNSRGLTYADKGQYDRAISDFNQAIEINPQFAACYYNRGIAYYKKEQYNHAISDYNQAIEINPQLSEAYLNRGTTYGDKGQYDRAISDYNQAIEINPRYAEAYLNLGTAYGDKGQYDQAISDFNKAIEINPRYAEAYNNRGEAYRNLEQYDHAISDYNKAIEINPQLSEVYSNRGIAYHSIGQYDKAISDHNKAIDINPRDAEAYCNRGNTYDSKGRYDHAISDYNKAIEINPQLSEAHLNRGNVYDNMGQYDAAILDFNRAIELNPHDATAYYNRGNSYSKKGQHSKAISDYNKAIEINTQLSEAYFNKALSCKNAGRIKDAIEAYENFIRYASPRYKPYLEHVRKTIKELEDGNLKNGE